MAGNGAGKQEGWDGDVRRTASRTVEEPADVTFFEKPNTAGFGHWPERLQGTPPRPVFRAVSRPCRGS